MEPVIKNIQDFGSWNQAIEFLKAETFHFLKSHEYPPETMPTSLCDRVVILGENRRVGFQHVPACSGSNHIVALCRLLLREKALDMPDVELADFLQGFLGQLKDKENLDDVARNIASKVSELFEAEGSAILVVNERQDALRFIATHSVDDSVADKLLGMEVSLTEGIAGWVATSKRPILVNKTQQDPRFSGNVDKQTDFTTNDLLAAPILLGDKLIGVLEVVNRIKRPFHEWELPTLCVVASVVAIFLEKAQLMAQRRKYLREAGKAEIANSVLHNIGNVLNSLTVSCKVMSNHLEGMRLDQLRMTTNLILEHLNDLDNFLLRDPRGKLIPKYLEKLSGHLVSEKATMRGEVDKISKKTHLMKDIIETQQTIARRDYEEAQDLIQVIEEAIAIQQNVLDQQRVSLVRDFQSDKPVRGTRTKIVHILINLIKNGMEAMLHLPEERRILRVETGGRKDGGVFVKVADQGYGIPPEIRERLFSHGFTTKEDGHGFGLNFCAKAMEEMNGSIEVESEGQDQGATFILTFPDLDKQEFLNI